MTDPTNTATDPTEASEADVETTEPAPTPAGSTDDDHGAALERAADAIRDAQDAEGPVAAHDDITTRDDEMAGEYSEDPGGEGGHP